MTTQLSLLKPLVASLARARFSDYEQKRRAWVAHADGCERCKLMSVHNWVTHERFCWEGAKLRKAFLAARQAPIGERLP